MSTPPVRATTTPGFFVQSVLSFGISVAGVFVGTVYLPVDPWMRAFVALGLLYVVTSAFTLAKCIRDRQEESAVTSRVDQARLDRLIAEHDPFRLEDA
ncbi:YiaA/YiaB family inner membrane protein [Nocardiopsis sediminis]|uniref:YiaA/YiaB family inner membrane protein n=1 Tax=Nocardiopsis sediminis TaxID=1778267 RepID=A0ABV8FLB3_9ACTN